MKPCIICAISPSHAARGAAHAGVRAPALPRPRPADAVDGSLHRTNRHGWGDVSLLKQDASLASVPHRSAGAPERPGRAAAAAPSARDGRALLFGTLSGAEAGGTDSWIGNIMVDPTKGRRSAAAPVDPKGRKGLGEVLSLASPGERPGWRVRAAAVAPPVP